MTMTFNAPLAAHELDQQQQPPPPPPQQQQQQQQQQHVQQQPQPPARPPSAPSPPSNAASSQHISQLWPQQPQHQARVGMNGMNGANMAGGGGGGGAVPTPAGHQAELNYIYGMVEELSRQLADNRKATEDMVNGLGRVRSRARAQGLSNDQILDSAAEELNGQEQNLDALISLLSESLEKAKHSRDANAALLSQYATVMSLLLKQFHEYKAKHVSDVAAWHRSYRAQLDEARRENCNLREQIWDMQAHAARANDSLRAFRSRCDEDERRWDRRVEAVAARQELRFWKRLAMPELEDDDTYWSGDDDIIDSAEKDRLQELERRAAQEHMGGGSQAGDSDGGDGPGGPGHSLPFQHMGVMGGIAMQREDTSYQSTPAPPPRPPSAASSTGSTGPSS